MWELKLFFTHPLEAPQKKEKVRWPTEMAGCYVGLFDCYIVVDRFFRFSGLFVRAVCSFCSFVVVSFYPDRQKQRFPFTARRFCERPWS